MQAGGNGCSQRTAGSLRTAGSQLPLAKRQKLSVVSALDNLQ
jgi:hypothetical protein